MTVENLRKDQKYKFISHDAHVQCMRYTGTARVVKDLMSYFFQDEMGTVFFLHENEVENLKEIV